MYYKDLVVWQKNQQCTKLVYQLSCELPNNRMVSSIMDQLFRSITSIGANLVEGSGSYKGKDFPRYLNIAFRTALESDHWLETAKMLFAEKAKLISNIQNINIEVIKMLSTLSQRIEQKRNATNN